MNSFKISQLLQRSGFLLALLALFAYGFFFVKGFGSLQNLTNFGLAVATVGIVASAMLFCLACGDFDLSVGSTLALSGIVATMVSNKTGNLTLGILAALIAGMCVGFINGIVIAKFKINALIATLAMMQIVRGSVQLLSKGLVLTPTHASYGSLGNYTILGFSGPVLLMFAAFGFFGVLLHKTVFGRDTLSIGGNIEAARLAGVRVDRTKIYIFMMSGMAAAIAGFVSSSRLISASNNAGERMELQAISACVLGGVSLSGGVGSISGVMMGVIMMGVVENIMRLRGDNPFLQLIVTGLILLAAVFIDKLKTRKQGS